MNVQKKDAAIVDAPTVPEENVSASNQSPGTWRAILSAPTQDRDGDTLTADGWKMPLPAKIPIDIDHEMTVRGTIGSAVPSIDSDGNLVVEGTFARTALAQEVRTLMADGHIDRMSVAFMNSKTEKDGRTVSQRELLNGAVVCIPSNRESAVLEVRNLNVKEGRRNNASDADTIQGIHDSAAALGAACGSAKRWKPTGAAKATSVRDLEKVLPFKKGASVTVVTEDGVIAITVGSADSAASGASPVETPGSPASPDDDAPVVVTHSRTSAETSVDEGNSPDDPAPAHEAAARSSADALDVATHPAVLAARAYLLTEED